MKAAQWVRLVVLSFAVMSAVGVIAFVACGPAAPASESGGAANVSDSVAGMTTEVPFLLQESGDGEKEEPTATPYPDDCMEFKRPDNGQMIMVCPEPGPRAIEQDLRKMYNDFMAEKELAAQEGRRSTLGAAVLEVQINTSTTDAVDDVLEFLEANGARVSGHSKESDVHAAGIVVAYVSIELLPSIIEIEGVQGVVEVHDAQPASGNLQAPPTMTAVERTRVDEWHQAGVTGSGVEVAVIDYDFRDFRARVLPLLSQPVEFFCYDGTGNPEYGQLPLPPATPPANFSACEASASSPPAPLPTIRPHGTDVAAALVETAPGVTLYISNANRRLRLVQAVDWLTAKNADNSATGVHYNNECDESDSAPEMVNVSCNDNFDVKIINHSQVYVWDGPGDGTSGFDGPMNRSPINVVGDAVERGALWTNAAGNGALRTWLAQTPTFDNDNRLEFGQSGLVCNSVLLDAGKAYNFQLRSNGSWPQGNVGTESFVGMILWGPLGAGVIPMTVAMGTQGRLDDVARYPWREMNYTVPGAVRSRYCIYVSWDLSRPDPSWLQLQMFAPDGTLGSASLEGSIDNPAESVNPGMLAVGAASNASPPMLQDGSARGPVPLAPHRDKPDVVGLNTDLLGTSFSSPRVAGMAALLVQGDGGSGSGASPTRVAGSMREHAVHPSSHYPDQEWGDGLAQLPSMAAPDIVSVSHDPCNRKRALRVDYSHPAVGTYPMAFYLKAQQVSAHGTGPAAYEMTHIGTIRNNPRDVYLDTGSDRGSYDVTAKTCTEAGQCGPESSSPTRFTTTAKVCDPLWFEAVGGDEQVTLWWNPDPDATGYKIELVGGNSFPVTGAEHVIGGLVNGGLYQYRLQVLGPGGPSEWTSPRPVTPRESTSRPPAPTNLRVESNTSRRFLGLRLRWYFPLGSHLYEVRVKGGGADEWKRLPFQPVGWGSEYSARFFGSHERVEDSFVLVGDAIIAGLIPGTEYHFAVRAARKRNSGERLDYSPWSGVVTLTTPGDRPVSAPGQVTAPPLKAPASDLMAVVDGTTVDLSWTVATNPNYVRQVVFRREAGVTPTQWTEIPVGLNDATYSDTGLMGGITYRYRVRSYKQLVDGNYGESGHAEAVIP